jgi:sirohydrochlorin cobaltochelatase
MRGIVLFAHGARDPEWARPFMDVCAMVRSRRPEYPIELAYLEIMGPTLEEAIASLVERGAPAITVFPLFMAQGGHLKQDVPRILDAIRAQFPNVPIALEPPIGEAKEVLEAIVRWVLGRID